MAKSKTAEKVRTKQLQVVPALLVTSSCTFNGGINTWDLTSPNKLELKVIQENGDNAPMIKIYYNNSEVQCIPAGIARNWRVIKESSTYFFRDQSAGITIGDCGDLSVFCLRYTGHENALALTVRKHGTTNKYVFVGTDDIRDGAPSLLTDYVFNIHNDSTSTAKSVNVCLRKLGESMPEYDFAVEHKSGLPTTPAQTCDLSRMPAYMCKMQV